MQEEAQKFLIKTYRNRTSKHNQETEPIWITNSIRTGIKRRKEYNRQARRAVTQEEKERLMQLYYKQKLLTKEEIKEAIHKHERIITDKIKRDKNSNMQLWKKINYLRGSENTRKEKTIYDSPNTPIPKEELKSKLHDYWKNIYQKHPCQIENVWSQITSHIH